MNAHEFLKKIFKPLSIIDRINIIFLIIICFFYAFGFNKTPYRITLLFVYFLLFIYLFAIPRLRNKQPMNTRRRALMFLHTVIYLFLIFETFFMLLPYLNELRFDGLLEKTDLFLLGVSPTIWIEQWAHPLLTDTLYLFYAFYFPMPLIILIWMYKKGKFIEVEKALFIYLFCYYTAYIIYFLIPAEGPRFFLQNLYGNELNGYIFAKPIRALINTLEPNKLDAFPSLHAAILGVTMFVSYKNNKRIFYWFIPAAIGITISLIYCRYHYFIDMIAGFFLAVFAVIPGGAVYNKMHSRFVNHFGSLER